MYIYVLNVLKSAVVVLVAGERYGEKRKLQERKCCRMINRINCKVHRRVLYIQRNVCRLELTVSSVLLYLM
jgi:hypothetical protein